MQEADVTQIERFHLGIAAEPHIRQDVDIVTVRLNYRFGGPVVARY
jgi:outer membrane immunogenic protein